MNSDEDVTITVHHHVGYETHTIESAIDKCERSILINQALGLDTTKLEELLAELRRRDESR